jgi:hypothetical protein
MDRAYRVIAKPLALRSRFRDARCLDLDRRCGFLNISCSEPILPLGDRIINTYFRELAGPASFDQGLDHPARFAHVCGGIEDVDNLAVDLDQARG